MKRQVTHVTNLDELNAACLQNGCTTGAELEERAPFPESLPHPRPWRHARGRPQRAAAFAFSAARSPSSRCASLDGPPGALCGQGVKSTERRQGRRTTWKGA